VYEELLGMYNSAIGGRSGTMDDELRARVETLEITVARLVALVDGRNRSAPTKRNMRDEDALAVLTGEFREMDHKQAASAIGLTYAQVYSCRLGFTFKHVHKELRMAGVELPWKR
jgi:hypothetical protein